MLPQPEPSTTTRGLSNATVPSNCRRTFSSRGPGEAARLSVGLVAAPRSATCYQKARHAYDVQDSSEGAAAGACDVQLMLASAKPVTRFELLVHAF
jgi:hypothetical protein